MRLRLLILLVFTLTVILSGCVGHGRRGRFSFGIMFTPIIIRNNPEKMYIHDGHIHDEFCGHQKRWYNGRWVFYYKGRWEYYDYNEQVYYYIQPELIENASE